MSRAQYLQTVRATTQASQSPAWLIGLVMAFAALALLNTVLMATADRRAKLSLVQLIGATRRQARRMIAWEALIATLAGLAGTLVPARLAQRARPMAAFGRGE
jgi:putative ABC transport system permease protein